MDAGTFADLVSRVGFPVAIGSFLVWQGAKMYRGLQDEQRKQTDAMHKHTEILTQISERLSYILRELDSAAAQRAASHARSHGETGVPK
jgi:hypothetical protein